MSYLLLEINVDVLPRLATVSWASDKNFVCLTENFLGQAEFRSATQADRARVAVGTKLNLCLGRENSTLVTLSEGTV